MITVIALVVIFGLLIFVHELGHFIAAKLMGVEVKSFAFGFPPTLFSKKVGETTYKINLLPLGGYVSLRGEDPDLDENNLVKEEKHPRSLLSKKNWQLLIIFVSGVVMNLILAVFLFYICYLVGFQPIMPEMANHPGVNNNQKIVITDIEKGAPAEAAGIQKGDVVKSVEGQDVFMSAQVIAAVQANSDKNGSKVNVVIIRDGKEQTKELATYKSKVTNNGKTTEVNRIGVVLENKGTIQGNIFTSFTAAVSETARIVVLTFVGIVDLFKQLITTFTVSNNVSGPVGIVVITNYFAQLGIVYLIEFAAILSISLAVFNILPIPGLDGGQMLIVILESIMRKKFSPKTKNMVQLIGFGTLICLVVVVTVKDVVNFDVIGNVKGWFGK